MDKILIVDDQENNRLVIEDILRRQPSSIRSVCSGKEALETVKEWVPDVMLIDHMMPELSGIETTRLLKEQPRFAHLPILIVTAKNDRQTLREAFDAGAVDYILKPVEKTTLLARINSAIRTKKAFDQVQKLSQNLLQQKQELQDFTHMVSHDLKSPVVGAASLFNLFLHRLQEDYPEIRNDPGMHELLDRIPGSFTKMLTFIDTLLNYAMAGKIIGDMQTVSLGKILQTVIEEFEQEQQQGIVRFKLPSKWPKVQCDVLKMSQVWQNLIGNSIKYRGNLDQVEIKIGTRISGNWCECWIEDNGNGIPSSEGDRIFKPFIRLDDSRQGSGIGLATVARILEAHKGIIRLDPRYQNGARFYMRWPHHSITK